MLTSDVSLESIRCADCNGTIQPRTKMGMVSKVRDSRSPAMPLCWACFEGRATEREGRAMARGAP